MNADELCELLIDGQNRLIEEKLYWRWVLYSMLCVEPVSFEEYKKLLHTPTKKSTKLILKEQKELLELFADGGKKVEL